MQLFWTLAHIHEIHVWRNYLFIQWNRTKWKGRALNAADFFLRNKKKQIETDVLFSVVDCRFINAFSYINAIRRRAVDLHVCVLCTTTTCQLLWIAGPAGVHRIRCLYIFICAFFTGSGAGSLICRFYFRLFLSLKTTWECIVVESPLLRWMHKY